METSDRSSPSRSPVRALRCSSMRGRKNVQLHRSAEATRGPNKGDEVGGRSVCVRYCFRERGEMRPPGDRRPLTTKNRFPKKRRQAQSGRRPPANFQSDIRDVTTTSELLPRWGSAEIPLAMRRAPAAGRGPKNKNRWSWSRAVRKCPCSLCFRHAFTFSFVEYQSRRDRK